MKTILVAVDFSSVTERVLDQARDIAGALQAGITLLHVAEPEPGFIGYEPGPVNVRESVAARLRAEHEHLAKLKCALEAPGRPVRALQVQGATGETILAEAEKLGASLIVVGSHGHGALWKLIVGSPGEEVLKHTSIPVLVVPAR